MKAKAFYFYIQYNKKSHNSKTNITGNHRPTQRLRNNVIK